MGITVSGPNGITIDFPEGTDQATISRVMTDALAKTKAAPQVSGLESAGRGALQGVTFGFGDELYAGAKGAVAKLKGGNFGDTYNQEVEAVRKNNAAAAEANPGLYMAGEIGSAFALPFGVGSLAVRGANAGAKLLNPARTLAAGAATPTNVINSAAGIGARSLQSAKTGAAFGAVQGFGTAEGGEGNLLQQAGNRAISALPSAAVGGLAGLALPGVIDAGAAVARSVTNPIRAAMNPQQMAQTKVAEALMRDAPQGMAVDAAVSRAGSRLRDAQAVKPDAILADVGGQNTRDLLRSASNMPSQGAEKLRNTLDRRQGFQWSRIERDLADTLADGDKFGRALSNVEDSLSKMGSREFKAAYAQPWNVRPNDPLAQFLANRPYVQELMQRTSKNVEGMTGQDPAKLSPWEFLHRVKMQMDKEIGRLKRGQQQPGDGWDLRDMAMLKREMVDLMGKANPGFKKAMDNYGDVAGVRTALEEGADEFKKASAGEITKKLAGMNRVERSMYRLGAARSLFNDIEKGNITRDRTEALFSSPEISKKLGALFDSREGLRGFQKRLILEARMADTRKAVQGNSTTAKQLAQGDEAGQVAAPIEAMRTGIDAISGRFGPVINYLSRQAQRFNGMTPSVANEVIKSMMAKGTLGTEQELVAAMEKAAKSPEVRAQLVQKVLSGIAAGTSAATTAERSDQRR